MSLATMLFTAHDTGSAAPRRDAALPPRPHVHAHAPLRKPGGLTPDPPVQVRPGRAGDLVLVLQAIASGALQGHFNPAMAQARVLLGLMWQLLGVCLIGRLWQPGLGWRPARLWVAERQQVACGFVLTVDLPAPASAASAPAVWRRLALVAVLPAQRGQGCGLQLLRHALAAAPGVQGADAWCLPASRPMQRLLRRLGFRSQGGNHAPGASTRVMPRHWCCHISPAGFAPALPAAHAPHTGAQQGAANMPAR